MYPHQNSRYSFAITMGWYACASVITIVSFIGTIVSIYYGDELLTTRQWASVVFSILGIVTPNVALMQHAHHGRFLILLGTGVAFSLLAMFVQLQTAH